MKRRNLNTVDGMTLVAAMSTISHSGKMVDDDTYADAKFSLLGRNFLLDADGKLYELRGEEVKLIIPHWVKNGIYPEYTFSHDGATMRIKAYVLSACALKKGVYRKYVSDKNMCINHTHNSVVNGYLVPTPEFSYNPAYLECISIGMNTIHGAFVRGFGLSGYNITSKTVSCLTGIIGGMSQEDAKKVIKNYLIA